jgi:fumarate reductase subunit D
MINKNIVTIPMTPQQRVWLRKKAFAPLVVLIISSIGFSFVFGFIPVQILMKANVSFEMQMFARTLIFLLIVYTILTSVAYWRHIHNHLADAQQGILHVEAVRLKSKHRNFRSGLRYYGEFEKVGSLILIRDSRETYDKLAEKDWYRVIYSPHTKYAWVVQHCPTWLESIYRRM